MSAVQRYLMLPNHVITAAPPQPRPQSLMEQFMENTPQEPQKPKKEKGWKYYLELIGSIILGIFVAKVIVRVIIPML